MTALTIGENILNYRIRFGVSAAMAEDSVRRASSVPSTVSLSRRNLLALGLAVAVVPNLALSQSFSSKQTRLFVGAPPGGSNDFGARLIAPYLSEALGTTAIVENKPGASGTIASDAVARAAPDGMTLLFSSASPVIIAPQAMPKAPFNPLSDFTAVNMVGMTPVGIAVNPRLGVKSLKDLIALSKTRQITLASSGTGGLAHLIIELLIEASAGNIVHIPYKGGGPGITDTMGGHVSGVVSDLPPFIPYHQEGRLLIIAVTSEKRLDFLPNVPTANETLPGFTATNWLGLFAPAHTPRPVIDKLNAALMQIVKRDDLKAQFLKGGVIASAMASPDVFQKFVADEYHRWGKVLRDKGITIAT
jgi:tripartite-type tricarboxylate transporter receptor subunit TctC